jgi:hypothetical protein
MYCRDGARVALARQSRGEEGDVPARRDRPYECASSSEAKGDIPATPASPLRNAGFTGATMFGHSRPPATGCDLHGLAVPFF